MITVYTDAAGKPHNIYGYCILETNEEKFIRSKFNLGSLEAEFFAMIEVLHTNTVRNSKHTIIYSDSESIIDFINRKIQARKGTVARLLTIQILNIIDNMQTKPFFKWVPRESNLAGILIEDEVPKKINKGMLFRESLLR
jgi:ribonuclease HI